MKNTSPDLLHRNPSPSSCELSLTQCLPLMEHVYTLQGEGAFQGQAAYFIRLGGCDVGCVWCDTKNSWDASLSPRVTIKNIVQNVLASGCNRVVVTGGEPTMHDLSSLTEQLQRANLRTHLETSGVYPLTGAWDWICLSPKKTKNPLPSFYAEAHELKVVVYHKTDIAWGDIHASKITPHCRKFLQPEWSRKEKITPIITEHIKKHPEWSLSLQMHKYLAIP